jgi:hypothetical protein
MLFFEFQSQFPHPPYATDNVLYQAQSEVWIPEENHGQSCMSVGRNAGLPAGKFAVIDGLNSGAAGFAPRLSKFAQLFWNPTALTVSILLRQMCAPCALHAASEQRGRIAVKRLVGQLGQGLSALVVDRCSFSIRIFMVRVGHSPPRRKQNTNLPVGSLIQDSMAGMLA